MKENKDDTNRWKDRPCSWIEYFLNDHITRNSLVIQRLGLHASTAWGTSRSLARELNKVVWHSQKKKKKTILPKEIYRQNSMLIHEKIFSVS